MSSGGSWREIGSSRRRRANSNVARFCGLSPEVQRSQVRVRQTGAPRNRHHATLLSDNGLIGFSCLARSVGVVVGCRTESWEALGTTVLLRTYSDRAADVRDAVGRELDAIDRALERFNGRGAVPLAPSALRFAVAAALVAGAGIDPALRERSAQPPCDGIRLDVGATAQAMATDRAAHVGESVGGDAVPGGPRRRHRDPRVAAVGVVDRPSPRCGGSDRGLDGVDAVRRGRHVEP